MERAKKNGITLDSTIKLNPENFFYSPVNGTTDILLDGGLRYPQSLWGNLFEYQKTCNYANLA
jgi:hypothetical protein